MTRWISVSFPPAAGARIHLAPSFPVVMRSIADRRRDSESSRKLAFTATSSPSRSPPRISALPSPRTPTTDGARLEGARRGLDEDDGAQPRVHQGGVRHDDARGGVEREGDVDVHLRLEHEARVRELEAHRQRAAVGGEDGADERDLPLERETRLLGERQRRLLPDRGRAGLVLVERRLDPDLREVRQREQLHAGLDLLPLEGALHGDVAGERGDEGHRLLRRPLLLQRGDEALGDVVELQAPARRADEVLPDAPDLRVGRGGELFGGLLRAQVLLLGRQQFGRVDRDQGLAGGDVLAREVHVQPLDPPLDLRLDVADPRLVRDHDPHGADRAAGGRADGRRGLHARSGAGRRLPRAPWPALRRADPCPCSASSS